MDKRGKGRNTFIIRKKSHYCYNHGQIHWDNTAFYVSTQSFSHILGFFATPSPPLPHAMLFGGNKLKTVCRTGSGLVYAHH